MAARFAAAEAEPPPFVREAITAIRRLLSGERTDLSFIDVDLGEAAEFERRVYAAARAIPPGETMTYGELAERIGAPGGGQAVGQALGRNPCPIIVPCHRILAADGKSGGFSAPGGADTKLKMLDIENARRGGAQPQLFDRLAWAAKPRARSEPKASLPRNDQPNPAR
jgi:methylated-DNA-[protein]-cysteine S-methyltransferase